MKTVFAFLVLIISAAAGDFVTLQFAGGGDYDHVRSVNMLRAPAPVKLPPGSSASVNMGCPKGKVALGGGCRVHEDDPYYVVLRSSYPVEDSNYTRWVCEWTNLSLREHAPDLPRMIYVLCGIAGLDENMCPYKRQGHQIEAPEKIFM